jgi:hypothetical protein
MSRHGYGVSPFDQHAELLQQSVISPEVAGECGYVSVDTDALGASTAVAGVP